MPGEVKGQTRFFIDIESLPPDESMRRRLQQDIEQELAAKNNSKADEARIEDLVEERFRQLALRGEYGRVLVIALIVEREGETLKRCLIGCDPSTGSFHLDERRTLRRFWNAFADFRLGRDLVIGHNIFDFDLLFLYKRSVIHRVCPSVEFPFARYRSQPIFDTMREWEKWGTHRIGLGRLAEVLGLESSKQGGIDGGRVYDHFKAGNHKEIALYCGRDADLVRRIYQRMKFVGGHAAA